MCTMRKGCVKIRSARDVLIAFQQNNSSYGAVPDPSFFVKGLARETSIRLHVADPVA